MIRSSMVPYSNPDTLLMRSLIVGIGQLLHTTCGLTVHRSKTKQIVPSFLGTPKAGALLVLCPVIVRVHLYCTDGRLHVWLLHILN